jgi:predicted 3-demethylubiquinone-9 3-methyltransferase (glyoxalase superfamily)
MNKITPFLWFNDNAEDAAEFYPSVFPEAKKLGGCVRAAWGPGPPERSRPSPSNLWASK